MPQSVFEPQYSHLGNGDNDELTLQGHSGSSVGSLRVGFVTLCYKFPL